MARSPKSRAAARKVKPSKKFGSAVGTPKAAKAARPVSKSAEKAKLSSPKAAPAKTTPSKSALSKTRRAKGVLSKTIVAGPSGASQRPSSSEGHSPAVEKAHPGKAAARAASVAYKAKLTPAKAGTSAKAKPASKTKIASKPETASKAKPGSTKRKVNRTAPAAEPRKVPPPYLAAELGQPVDHEGEPIGASAASARSDRDLQDYALQLWRQMQSGRGVSRYIQKIERAGLTMDDLWASAMTAPLHPTSSTADDLRRYRQKALFRANLLEAILSETVADLRRLDTIAPAETTSEPG